MQFFALRKLVLGVLMFVILVSISTANAKAYKVALFTPRSSDFWDKVSNSMEAAANNLGVEFQRVVCDDNHLLAKKKLEEIIKGPNKVDAIVFNNFKNVAAKFIEIADEGQVYSILFNSRMPPEDEKRMGKPREKYKYWLAELYPDEEGSGVALANLLFDKAKELKKNSDKVRVIGLNGPRATGAAMMRLEALNKAVDSRSDVVVHRVLNMPEWGNVSEAHSRFVRVFQTYPETIVAWSAHDRLTQGVISGMAELNLVPGKDIVTCGYNLSEDIIAEVEAGKVAGAVGGHFIDGVWALVLLYDYFHGRDFGTEATTFMTPMGLVRKENVSLYKKITKEQFSPAGLKGVDFKRFSKVLNPKLKKYNFNIEAVLSQI